MASPAAMTVRRPEPIRRGTGREGGVRTATEATVATTPMVAVGIPSEARSRLKSIRSRLRAAPAMNVVTRNRQAADGTVR